MSADYTYYDNNEARTITQVLNPVSLTGVATNTTAGTENFVTVASTAELYAGMAVNIPNVPLGSFIHVIRSSTQIELYRSAWNASTGVFTTSGANAAATAVGSGLLGSASGFDPCCLVTQFYAKGVWRNLHNAASNAGLPAYVTSYAQFNNGGYPFGQGVAMIPSTGSFVAGQFQASAATFAASDTLATTPLKRHNGEPWAFFILVSTGGFRSLVPALPGRELLFAGTSV